MVNSMTDVPLQLSATERAAAPGAGRAGPVVVFLHGLGCERGQFARQMEGLDPRLRLISLDLPGHGQSPELRDRPYTLASMTRAVIEELSARGHLDVVLVGHSAGGLIALRAAVEHPTLVRGLVALDTNMALSKADMRANTTRAQESEVGEWRRYFMASMATSWGDDDGAAEHQRASVFGTLARTPEHVVRPFWHDILMFEPESFWRQCQVVPLEKSSSQVAAVTVRRLGACPDDRVPV
ncbi:alpha/beta hydrolase, partial [Streptomyces sp. NPDC005209]|uniref:alpha/beta fold hydrolase n=1 Tax=Streptomyces sp. NPDC005209 TaxID=3156715 RepID=UPI0033B5F470